MLGAILVVAIVSAAPLGALASRFGGEETGFIDPATQERKAHTVVSGDNIYLHSLVDQQPRERERRSNV
ncbi:MAG: hypothetical protein M3115_05725 [Thermoproteota archaeon]|nr:hypothetical protein [Thermoproteota archaeon]